MDLFQLTVFAEDLVATKADIHCPDDRTLVARVAFSLSFVCRLFKFNQFSELF